MGNSDSHSSLRIAVDTGGTFTDVVVLDEETGVVLTAKAPTTPHNTMFGILAAVEKLDIDLSRVGRFFLHGSTTALNALIQRKGARVAFVGTEGFTDVVEFGRVNRPGPEIYNIRYRRPPALVPRSRRFGVAERTLADGTLLRPIDEECVRQAAALIRASGAESVAVCLLHSYRNPEHELRTKAILEEQCPGVHVSISSNVAPEHKEYERGMTTIVDAYLAPVISIMIDELAEELERRGMSAELLMTRSDGGAMTAAAGKEHPVQALLSGPAGGVMGGVYFAEALGHTNLINVDMGGTSFDVCMIKNGKAELATQTKASGYDLLIPNLDIRAIGAGGGSIAWIDPAGGLHVGPHSAGANPGPMCYGKGGDQPTVTDALVCAGFIGPSRFLGGEMPLDEELARNGLTRLVAEPLGLSLDEASVGVLQITVQNMIEAIRGISVQRGEDPRDFSLLCYGGGGPLFGPFMAKELEMKSAIVPIAAANFSAWGMLTADIHHAFSETRIMMLGTATGEQLEETFGRLEANADLVLEKEGIAPGERELRRSLDMRYDNQEHTVNVPLQFALDDNEVLDQIYAAFSRRYEGIFGYQLPIGAEIVTLRVAALGRIPNPIPARLESDGMDPQRARIGSRTVLDLLSREPVECAVYARTDLRAKDTVAGPALVEEDTTITWVPGGSTCTVDPIGNLVVTSA